MSGKIIIYTDGGSRGNPGPAASAFVALKDGQIFDKGSSYLGVTTNNQAEYKAVILALLWLLKNKNTLSPTVIEFYLDSELITYQLTGKYKVKDPGLHLLFNEALKIKKQLNTPVSFNVVRRENNKDADRLVNETLDLNVK